MYKLKLLIICAVTLLLPIEIFAQDSFDLSEVQTKFIGETAGDQLSFESVSVVGDVNNDGYNDVLVGAYADDTGGTDAGAAYLIYGPISSFGDFDLADADVKFIGENAGDYAGSSVAVSDVNQDGYDDILVGAYTDDTGGSNAGAVYLIYGSASLTSSIDLSLANVKFIGEETNNVAGYSIYSDGDVNSDGYNDILIGAPNGDNGLGAVYLFYTPVSLSGEVDLSAADAKFSGEYMNDGTGISFSSAGDINNDGYDDILIGAGSMPAYDMYSKVYLIYGSSLLSSITLNSSDVIFNSEATGDHAGISVTFAGDINNDGYDDILIGADHDDTGGTNAGAAYLIYGSNSLASSIDLSLANVKFIGEEAEDNAGYFVSSAGDVNNDGYDDILIGAYADDTGGTNAGAAYLIYGSNSLASSIDLSLANVKFIGEEAEDAAGFTVSSAGDVNNDGFGDILIGAYLNDAGGTDAGAVYLSYLYIDVDGDGVAGTTGLLSGTDCNDSDATISENQTYYQDLDGDGIGNTDETTQACSYTAPDSYAANSGDCDDNEPGIYQEIVYYSDSDRDGLGDPNSIISVCSLIAPEGYVMNSDDEYPEYKDISSVESAEDGKVKITYVNNDVIYYQVFNISTNSKTKIIEYNFQYYLVLNSTGKKLALIDIHALSTLSKKTLSKKKKYSTNYLLSKEMRSKHFIVVVSKKGSKVLLSLVKLNLSKEIISLSDQQKINNKNISPQKTTVKDTSIKLKNKKSKVLLVYTVTKKYHLKEK